MLSFWTNSGANGGSDEPVFADGDLIDGLDAEQPDEDQPRRKKLKKRAQLIDDGDAEDEIAPLDEDGDTNAREAGARDDKSVRTSA
jgi:hypothetical protein